LPVEAAPTLHRDRSLAARSTARRKKAEREMRIVGFMNGGVSIAEIAAREGVTERGMRKYVRGLLARRAPEPPEAFMALQASRLRERAAVVFTGRRGQERKKRPGGQRNPLRRLNSGKENKVNSLIFFGLAWPDLARSGKIWGWL
jgi:DNA-binding CsgD family transcriptional regulator